jgi:Cu/Zn superoxide dismutase
MEVAIMYRFIAASAVLLVAASAAANETPRSELSRAPAVHETGTPDADVAPFRIAQAAKGGAAAKKSAATPPLSATAELKSADGKDVGTAKLTQTRSGVRIALTLKGLPAGEHAFHVHAVGKCEPPLAPLQSRAEEARQAQ